MTTIHPLELAFTIATQGSVDLIDLRPREEFDRAHIRGARSIPLPQLRAAKITSERGIANPKPLYLICNERTRAGLAAGILRGAGCLEPVVVEGGMELWEAQGLPATRPWQFAALKNFAAAVRLRVRTFLNRHREIPGRIERPIDNAWWYRDEFQTRQAYRA